MAMLMMFMMVNVISGSFLLTFVFYFSLSGKNFLLDILVGGVFFLYFVLFFCRYSSLLCFVCHLFIYHSSNSVEPV